jgi:hypothetical protein
MDGLIAGADTQAAGTAAPNQGASAPQQGLTPQQIQAIAAALKSAGQSGTQAPAMGQMAQSRNTYAPATGLVNTMGGR